MAHSEEARQMSVGLRTGFWFRLILAMPTQTECSGFGMPPNTAKAMSACSIGTSKISWQTFRPFTRRKSEKLAWKMVLSVGREWVIRIFAVSIIFHHLSAGIVSRLARLRWCSPRNTLTLAARTWHVLDANALDGAALKVHQGRIKLDGLV